MELPLLEDLDRRQNEVLDRLVELNARVEMLLKECLAARDPSSTPQDDQPVGR